MAETEPPADVLRQAADHMSDHHGPGHPRHAFWSLFADWLGSFEVREAFGEYAADDRDAALAIARAYLDGAK